MDMTVNELNYGNFAEPKEEKTSKRSEEVVLTAIQKCELLEEQLKKAYELIDELKKKIQLVEYKGKVK